LYVLLLVIAIASEVYAFGVSDSGNLVVAIGGAIPLLVGIGVIQLIRVSTQYRLFPDRLEIESGLLAKNIENIKLFRVRDIGLGQGVLGRVLGFGDVSLASTDTSAPHAVMRNIDGPREVYDKISEIVSQASAQRRTMIVEDMDQAGEVNAQ
jgi:membrane protein YdbS with pleckstrin-like domain